MKHFCKLVLGGVLLSLLITSCNNSSNAKATNSDSSTSSNVTATSENKKKDICWMGTIDKKIPFFLHYQIYDSVVVGEVVYMHSIDKRPITLIGTIDSTNIIQLNEFEKTGNVTGVWDFETVQGKDSGVWRGTKTWNDPKDLVLIPKDTTIYSQENIIANSSNILGKYYYQYGEDGYQGGVDVNKVSGDKIAFDASSVTSAPARNVANIDKDTVQLKGNQIVYTIDANNGGTCKMKISFYTNFLIVKYIQGDCANIGGMNATLEGIYYKIK